MKKVILMVIFVLLIFYFWQCAEKSPLDIYSSKQLLTVPQSHPIIEASGLVDVNGSSMPGYLNGNIRSDRVTLNWATSTDADFIYYKIIRDDNEIEKFTNRSVVVMIDSTLQQNTRYTYMVANVIRNGTALVDTIEIKTPRFETPYFVGYQILPSSYNVRLIWENSFESASSYEVFRAEHPDSAHQLVGTTTTMGDTSLTDDDDLNTGFYYYYRVYGKNDYEQLDTSNYYPVLVNYDMTAPIIDAEYNSATRSVTIQWVDRSTGEDGFRIYRGLEQDALAQIGAVPTNMTEFIDSDSDNLLTDSTYYYAVRAYNSVEMSDTSNIDSVTISQQSMVEIGTGSNSWVYPFYTGWHDARIQILYLASEINQAMNISAIAFNVTSIPGMTMNIFVVRMKHSPLPYYTSYSFDNSGYTNCLYTNLTISSTGWVEIPLTTSFSYNGSSNLIIDISFDNDNYIYSGYCLSTYTSDQRSITYYTDSGMGNPLTWLSGSTQNYIPNIRLY
jgi:hypothetical protein